MIQRQVKKDKVLWVEEQEGTEGREWRWRGETFLAVIWHTGRKVSQNGGGTGSGVEVEGGDISGGDLT